MNPAVFPRGLYSFPATMATGSGGIMFAVNSRGHFLGLLGYTEATKEGVRLAMQVVLDTNDPIPHGNGQVEGQSLAVVPAPPGGPALA